MKISVIVPNFNSSHFLKKTLASLTAQSQVDREILVIDGGSTDKSIEVIKTFESQIDFWISEKDSGQSDAINKGLKHSSGEIVNWINSDDLLVPESLLAIRNSFKKTPDADFIYGDTQIIDHRGSILQTRPEIGFSDFVQRYGGNLFAQPSCFFRRSAAERLGWLDENLHWSMDYDFYLRALNAGMVFRSIPTVIGQFRLHPNSKTGAQHAKFVEEHFKVHRKYANSWLLQRRLTYRTLKVLARTWRVLQLWRQRGVWQPGQYSRILTSIGVDAKTTEH